MEIYYEHVHYFYEFLKMFVPLGAHVNKKVALLADVTAKGWGGWGLCFILFQNHLFQAFQINVSKIYTCTICLYIEKNCINSLCPLITFLFKKTGFHSVYYIVILLRFVRVKTCFLDNSL